MNSKVLEKCGCEYILTDESVKCNGETHRNCLNKTYEEVSKDIQSICHNCPLDCELSRYDISSSTAAFPSKSYAMLLYNNTFLKNKYPVFDFNKIKQDVFSIQVYFGEMQTTNYVQLKKFDQIDLLSSIGGFLGLFLGASLLTLAEFSEAIITVILGLCLGLKSKLTKIWSF